MKHFAVEFVLAPLATQIHGNFALRRFLMRHGPNPWGRVLPNYAAGGFLVVSAAVAATTGVTTTGMASATAAMGAATASAAARGAIARSRSIV
jgi:hypothetical protein